MSQEVYTPVIDSYRGTEREPVELPQHIKDYADISPDPGATPAEKAAHETEMQRVWQENYDLGELFRSVDSEKFDKAHNQLLVRAVNAHLVAQQLVEAVDLKGTAVKKQIARETMQAIENEAARQAEQLLPLTEENYSDEEAVLMRRSKLAEMLMSDIAVKADGQAIKRQPKAFQSHLKDWRKYEQLAFAAEVELLHHQANLDNARFSAGEHRRVHKYNFEALDSEHGGLFDRIRRLPIDRYAIPLAGGRTTSLGRLSDGFKTECDSTLEKPEVKAIITRRRAGEDRAEKTAMLNRLLATRHLEPVLRATKQAYEAQGISGMALKVRMEAVDADLKAWLADDKAREDYYLYDASRNGYEMRVKKGGRFALRFINRVGKDAYVGLPGTGRQKKIEYKSVMPQQAKDAMKVRKLSTATLTPRAAALAPKRRWPERTYIGHGQKPYPPSKIEG